MLIVITLNIDNYSKGKTKFDNYPKGKTKQNFKMTIILNGKNKIKIFTGGDIH